MARSATKSRSVIASSPHYGEILRQYNEIFERNGKVNAKKFFEEVVTHKVDISLRTWYVFLNRFKTQAGLVAAQLAPPSGGALVEQQESKTLTNFAAREVTQQQMLGNAAAIGAKALEDILANPDLMPIKERAELALKAMKAEDSRAKAKVAVRQDHRDEEAFQRAMDDGAYGTEFEPTPTRDVEDAELAEDEDD